MLIDANWPVIALLQAADLPDGVAGLHAVVIVNIEDREVTFLDPMQTEVTVMPLHEFLLAWNNLDNQGMVVWVLTE